MNKHNKKGDFKAVDYVRRVRADPSQLYQTDKGRFHAELKQAAADFLARRKKPAHSMGLAQAGPINVG